MRSIARNRINRRVCLSTALSLPAAALALAGCQVSLSAGGPDYEKLESEITGELNKRYTQIARDSVERRVPTSQQRPRRQARPSPATPASKASPFAWRSKFAMTTTTSTSARSTPFSILRMQVGPLTQEVSAELGFPVTVLCGEGLKVVAIGDSLEVHRRRL